MFKAGNIVKGINAGLFIVMGYKQIAHENTVVVVEINPENHSQRSKQGNMYFAESELVLVQEQQCHYITRVDGVHAAKMLQMWEDFAASNPGNPIKDTGSVLAIVFNPKANRHEYLAERVDRAGRPAGFENIGYGRWHTAYKS